MRDYDAGCFYQPRLNVKTVAQGRWPFWVLVALSCAALSLRMHASLNLSSGLLSPGHPHSPQYICQVSTS